MDNLLATNFDLIRLMICSSDLMVLEYCVHLLHTRYRSSSYFITTQTWDVCASR
jgi:hypothetical protein